LGKQFRPCARPRLWANIERAPGAEIDVAQDEDKLQFLKSSGTGFGTVGPAADLLRNEKGNGHPSVTETYWFEVLVPGSNLIAHFYIYMRPNLAVCSAGAWMSRGHVEHPLLMDHFNYQAALPMPRWDGDTVSVPEIGLSVHVLEPLQRFEIRYAPPNSTVRTDLVAQAVMPPAVRNTNKHLNQFMRYTGTIRLDADEIAVDDIAMRDRSWGEERNENANAAPVTAWASGFFEHSGTAFNLIGFDDPTRGAEWAGAYPISSDKTLMDGWYLKNGRLTRIVRMSKRTWREPHRRMAAQRVEVDFEDADGGRHRLSGITRASCWMQNWPNVYVWLPLMEWELDGARGWGDCQEYCWADYARRYWK
jgi:hypothetical protein